MTVYTDGFATPECVCKSRMRSRNAPTSIAGGNGNNTLERIRYRAAYLCACALRHRTPQKQIKTFLIIFTPASARARLRGIVRTGCWIDFTKLLCVDARNRRRNGDIFIGLVSP